jgi:hypothetical protein
MTAFKHAVQSGHGDMHGTEMIATVHALEAMFQSMQTEGTIQLNG